MSHRLAFRSRMREFPTRINCGNHHRGSLLPATRSAALEEGMRLVVARDPRSGRFTGRVFRSVQPFDAASADFRPGHAC